MKKLSMTLTAAMLAGMMIIVSGCGQTKKSTSNKKVSKEVKNVVDASGVIKSSNIEDIMLSGTQIPMTIKKIDVNQGDVVKKGDKLVELDTTDINYQIQEKKDLVQADKYVRDNMNAAPAAAPTATSAQGNLQAAAAAQAAQQSQPAVSDDQKKSQDSKIAAEQAEVDELNAQLNKPYISGTNVVSDMDNAVVSEINYSAGDIPNAQEKLLCLQDIKNIYAEVNVDEEFINDIKVGNSVTITPASDTSSKLTGKVTRIGKTAITEKNGGTVIPVDISIDNNNGKLFPNYNVDVEISK